MLILSNYWKGQFYYCLFVFPSDWLSLTLDVGKERALHVAID